MYIPNQNNVLGSAVLYLRESRDRIDDSCYSDLDGKYVIHIVL